MRSPSPPSPPRPTLFSRNWDGWTYPSGRCLERRGESSSAPARTIGDMICFTGDPRYVWSVTSATDAPSGLALHTNVVPRATLYSARAAATGRQRRVRTCDTTARCIGRARQTSRAPPSHPPPALRERPQRRRVEWEALCL